MPNRIHAWIVQPLTNTKDWSDCMKGSSESKTVMSACKRTESSQMCSVRTHDGLWKRQDIASTPMPRPCAQVTHEYDGLVGLYDGLVGEYDGDVGLVPQRADGPRD